MSGAGTLASTCVIAGGGPAGIMLGLLLARVGIDVVVLEKHGDFLRDFRGDTLHPSTLEVMHELGLLDDLLKRPHQKVTSLGARIGDRHLNIADFSHLPTRCRYIALMPQWDFLDFVSDAAGRYAGFRLLMNTRVDGLIEEGGRVAGVNAQGPDGPISIRAHLVIGADGRHSTVRQHSGLKVIDKGAPIDVLWLRIPRRAEDPAQTLGRVDFGKMLIMIDRGDYWQCAFIIEKGGFDAIKQRGLPAFRAALVQLVPSFRDRVAGLTDWRDIKLLTVTLDCLRDWAREGLLCIGDAAHAMSPVGGVGINLAIQDAVAAANILTAPLLERRVRLADLQALQRRRRLPTRLTQAAQVLAHKRMITPALQVQGKARPPWPLKALDQVALLRRLPGRAIGLGVRPEHVRGAPVGD